MDGPSFFAGPFLDFFPTFFAEFGSNGHVYESSLINYHLAIKAR
jgi:hypothetical protein